MRATELIDFLDGRLAGRELQALLEDEVALWVRRLAERGRSAPVALVPSGSVFIVSEEHALRLIDGLVCGHMSPQVVAYILDALFMAEEFEWRTSELRDTLELLSDPEQPSMVDVAEALQTKKLLLKADSTGKSEN